jgi:hypothetical protein
MARIGTVCEATTNGSNPRRRTSERRRTVPPASPIAAPSRNPAAASLAVNQAASSRSWISSGPPGWLDSNSLSKIDQREGLVMSSTTSGHVQPVSVQSQRYPD